MPLSRAAAFACGVALFALPFLQSGFGDAGHFGGACAMDHEPHHGGSLVMLGEFHLETVEQGDRLELFVSDLSRRPLRPDIATVAFDDGAARDFEWQSYRLVAARPPSFAAADYSIRIGDKPALRIRLPRGQAPSHGETSKHRARRRPAATEAQTGDAGAEMRRATARSVSREIGLVRCRSKPAALARSRSSSRP